MPNRLIREKSPYLLQHAHNPVDWYAWGEEAFNRAVLEDKPVFLSVGYATCHWCHVMEHESFEDPEVARILNEHVVSIKVDREERPDLDQIYMNVCQVLTGGGGWPLSVFLTPDKKPFFAGTYFPKSGRMGMIGLIDIVRQVADLWKNQREKLINAGNEITRAIQPKGSVELGGNPDRQVLEHAYQQLKSSFDPTWGGFGDAPKFPTPHHLTFLLRYHLRFPDSEALAMVEKTLDAMRDGGIFDQIGLGFHRYSVDARWLVPHFEKMLYDQAMLAMAYTEAFQVTGKAHYGKASREIFEYVLRDMRDSTGGFYSAEDADSEGKEGVFYVWTPEEVRDLLGEDSARIFCRYCDIGHPGNFEEGKSIPHVSKSIGSVAQHFGMSDTEVLKSLEESRQRLFSAREMRIHPFKDDKILTSWNGLMIAALAKGYQALGDPTYLLAAERAAGFILQSLRQGEGGRLFRRYRHGEVAHSGYADDYSFLVWGLIELYESSFNPGYLREALNLQQQMIESFGDDLEGGFFFTPADGEQLIVRNKELYDGATPSSNSVAVLNLLRLAGLTGNKEWEDRADKMLKAFSGLVSDYPSAYTQFLNAVDFALGPTREIVIVGNPEDGLTQEMIATAQAAFIPNRALIFRSQSGEDRQLIALCPFVEPLHPVDGRPTVYVCENKSCKSPIGGMEELKSILLPSSRVEMG